MLPKSIARYFLKNETITSCTVFGEGHIHGTYKITTNNSNFILQCINTDIFQDVPALMQNIANVSQYLQQQPTYPLEILTTQQVENGNSYYQHSDNSYWRMFPFIENTTTLSVVETSEQAYTIAHAFGTFIAALSPLPHSNINTIIPNFHDGLYRFRQLQHAIPQAATKRLQLAKTAIQFILEEKTVFEHIAALHLPIRIVHNDTKANNILLDKDSLAAKCVIDLDTVMCGTLLSDFGDMVRTCCNSEAEDSKDFESIEMRSNIYQALEAGFLESLHTHITRLERENLLLGTKWIILEQATRFLTDFLENDHYYKTYYPTHNLIRAGNQIALYKSLIEQENSLSMDRL